MFSFLSLSLAMAFAYENVPFQVRHDLDDKCPCQNPNSLCQIDGICYPYKTKEQCDEYRGLFCTPKPCELAGCKSCTSDGEECIECEDNHILLSHDTCASLNTTFAGISNSSFALLGNLVLFSNEQIADSLTAGFAGVKGRSRYAAIRHAIAAFSHHFKDQFDAVVVFPSTQQQENNDDSTYTQSRHFTWKTDYAGAPKLLRSAMIHNMHNHCTATFIPFKREIIRRFGVFNKLIPQKTGNSWATLNLISDP